MHRGEGPLLRPDRPDDSGELVRDGDGGHVMATALLGTYRPALRGAADFACQRNDRAPWINSMRR
jgi:hypothetical protein